jgi:tetratricopeptide (TPR) repeat protein
MSDQWNDNLFDEFILLRDGLRAAKRDKNYQHVLSLGQQIIELDKSAQFLRIATPIFLKDMGNACVKLGDNTAAIKYFKDAIEKDDYQVSSGVAVSCLYVMVGVARAARRSRVSRSCSMDLRLRR